MSLWMRWEERNPMLAETRIVLRRWLGLKGDNLQAKLVIAAVCVVVLGIIGAVARYSFLVDTTVAFPIAWVLLGLVSIITLHGALAREREKRSMEVLLTTPLTAKQIVLGKLTRAVPAITAILVCVPIFLLASGLGRAFFKENGLTWGDNLPAAVVMLALLGYLVSSSFFAMCLTMAVSAITQRVAASLLLSFALWVVVYLIVPIILSSIFWGDAGISMWHPMAAFFALVGFSEYSSLSSFIVIGWQLALGAGLLVFAIRRMSRETQAAGAAVSG
ncbi:MAG: hypothetical protein Fur0036_18110 [Fimbriimonadaceae bacterium]